MTLSPVCVLEGLSVAKQWHSQLLPLSRSFCLDQGRQPGLAVVRVGQDPASLIYINNKRQKAASLEIHFEEHVLPVLKDPTQLTTLLDQLNQASHIDGVILQLPLPAPYNQTLTGDQDPLLHLDPQKDVDGLHPFNRGLLFSQSAPLFVPCTPLGCLRLLKAYQLSVAGREVVVMGRSVLVGRPLAALLLQQNATVTIVHSQTHSPQEITRRADFVFVAIGKAGHVTTDFFKKGAVVIDIGIHPGPEAPKGDVAKEALAGGHLRALSPVPGGVGPLTVMGLMHNTVKAAFGRCGLSFPL